MSQPDPPDEENVHLPVPDAAGEPGAEATPGNSPENGPENETENGPEAEGGTEAEPEAEEVTVAPEARVRCFLAVNFPIAVVRRILDEVTELRGLAAGAGLKVSWVPPANLHLTLKFLGMVRGEVVEAIRDRLRGELPAVRPFEAEARGLGAFPSPSSGEQPRVLWAGAGPGEKELVALARTVETAMESLGFPRESRPFHPHITLGRVLSEGPISVLLTPERKDKSFGTGRIAEVVVYESRTWSRGAEYRALGRIPLGR